MISSLQRIAVEEGRRQFRARGGPALYVTVHFVENQPRTKSRAYSIGKKLAAIVESNGWSGPGEGDRRYYARHEIPEIGYYDVVGSGDGIDELWSNDGGGPIATVEPEYLSDCLTAKNHLHHSYSSNSDEVWLLIVNDMFRGGAPCRLGSAARSHHYQVEFNRVFWFDTANSDVVELS